MKFSLLVVVFAVCVALSSADEESKKSTKKQLQIGIKKKVENCQLKSKKGDSLSM